MKKKEGVLITQLSPSYNIFLANNASDNAVA
jgi:hypothetical protein